jgi:hypothetical protein
MAKVQVTFSAHSEKYDAKPGDTKSVAEEEVPALEHDGVATVAKDSKK